MNTKSTTSAIDRLDRYIRAKYPVIAIVSHEEKRVCEFVKTIAANRSRQVFTWAITTGIVGGEAFNSDETRDPGVALQNIAAIKPNEPAKLVIMKDIQKYFNDPTIVRGLRDIVAAFEGSKHVVICLGAEFTCPVDLEKNIAILDWPLPDEAELAEILNLFETSIPNHIPNKLNGGRERLISALRGLTAFEAGSVLMAATAATGELSESIIPHIIGEKRGIIRRGGLLEYFDTSEINMNSVGGLGSLKQYANIKARAFSAEARAFGVDAPKGVLLVGVPGTGKSLAAKAMASGKMPLIRMDVGALMGGLVGQSEGNMRSALKLAEAVSPCVLWIDEIEKALGAGLDGAASDGGTTMRVFGTLLTWMAETSAPVYVVATANDATVLKPELIRRFDDIFWVDLPNRSERLDILKVHLTKRGRNVSKLGDVQAVLDQTWGYSGAEIEKTVKHALELAFFDNHELTAADLLQSARSIVPISASMGEKISTMRAWAKGRALWAGEQLETRPETATVRQMDEL